MTILSSSLIDKGRGYATTVDDAIAEARGYADDHGLVEPRISVGGPRRFVVPEGTVPWEVTGRRGRRRPK